MNKAGSAANNVSNPLWLLAEVTYKCPLHCTFCYNPVDYARYGNELTTEEWLRVLREGRALGATQLGFSGGEPLMRDDLEVLIAEARKLGYYTNLITSGVGLTEKRIQAFADAGLDHIQLSFQDSTRELNDFISSTKTFDLKMRVAELIRKYDYPTVLNVVLHRINIDHIQQILDMAESLGVEYLELANTQYYGWAMLNRDQLMPTREQLLRAEDITNRFREKIGDRMRIYFVISDYFEERPKACMNGWGSVFITVTPDGAVLPCHAARILPGIQFPNVRDAHLEEIWYGSQAFNQYRGDAWMKEPCRSCAEKDKDYGGCRCQAYMLTGDAANADPVCSKSPHHQVVLDAVAKAQATGATKKVIFRSDPNSRGHGAKEDAAPAH